MASLAELEQLHRDAVASLVATQKRLGAIADKTDPQRTPLKLDIDRILADINRLKDQIKLENTRRNYAGFGSPLHEACAARLPPELLALLEQDALGRLEDRERRAAERKAAKAAAGPSSSSATSVISATTNAPKTPHVDKAT